MLGAGNGQKFNLQVTNANRQALNGYPNLSTSNLSSQSAVSGVNSDSSYLRFMAPGVRHRREARPRRSRPPGASRLGNGYDGDVCVRRRGHANDV